jgi:5-methylcytosine-specific restriction endonuclease McrA
VYWWESVEQALGNLGGNSSLKDLYPEVRNVRLENGDTTPVSLEEVVRKELEYNSSDSSNWRGTRDIFFSVHGLGNGVWGLRDQLAETPKAIDLADLDGNQLPPIEEQTIMRVIRDTGMTRKIKTLHANKCQICGSSITLPDGRSYSEAHHIIPLGAPHHGPDTPENILVVCPNHHAMLDFGCILLDGSSLRSAHGHSVSSASIEYHNAEVSKGKPV